MFGWLKDEPPDAWTPERRTKVRILDQVAGDLDAARNAWALRSRLQFTAYLVDNGRIGQGDDRSDD